MITAKDSDFHARDPSDRTWTETTFLPFFIPEAGIFGNVYVLARPNVGIAISSILISEGFCLQPYEVDFTDAQMHLPCPESFTKYSLGNGLNVEVTKAPVDYNFSYENPLGACSFDLSFRGMHQPFDPHDPKENPLLGSGLQQAVDPRIGAAWQNGHFEVKGHITGDLTLRGRTYKVDCYEGMDHSWGPRSELSARSAAWMSINFGADLAFHLAMPLELRDGEVHYDGLRFGFVVDNGEVFGLVEATVVGDRIQMMPLSNRVHIKDVRGREWDIVGNAVAGHPWYSFNPSTVSYQSYMRYQCGARVGYGEVADIFGLEYLAQKMSRAGKRMLSGTT